MYKSPTSVEIDLKALGSNLTEIKRLAKRNASVLGSKGKSASVIAVVKAEAYGHGMVEVARHLYGQGVRVFGVSDVAEGLKLRQARIKGEILLFESALPTDAAHIIKHQLTPTISSFELVERLNKLAAKGKKQVRVHIKVDTGMGRLGVPHKDALEFIKKVSQLKFITIEGLYTHLPLADTNRVFTQTQIKKFKILVQDLNSINIRVPYLHAANSAGLLGQKTDVFNLIRPGIMLYGLFPDGKKKSGVNLKAVMSVKSKVVCVKTLEKGQGVSYGWNFIAKRKMTIAIIPIGYANGYFRALSNKAYVLVGGKKCPVLGNVTMDQIIVDVTGLKGVKLGDAIVILGRQGKFEITADELAKFAHTINYEILCALGKGSRRVINK